jgi:phage host-nuclease inhibitor protein Gam
MAKAVTRIKKTQTAVPASLEQADALLVKIGQTQNAINEIEADLAKKIAELRTEADKKLAPLTLERDNQINSLFSFANPRKARLTEKARTVKLSGGVFGWRWTTPRVELARSEEDTISMLKRTGNEAYVRVIEEVDRQKLLAERPVIPGITFSQKDEFFVTPKQEAKKPKTLTKAIDR